MPSFRGLRVNRPNSGQEPKYDQNHALRLLDLIKHHENASREAELSIRPGTSREQSLHLLATRTEHAGKAEELKRQQKKHDALKPSVGSKPPTAPPKREEKEVDLSRAPKLPPKQKMNAPKPPPKRF